METRPEFVIAPAETAKEYFEEGRARRARVTSSRDESEFAGLQPTLERTAAIAASPSKPRSALGEVADTEVKWRELL
eukprot:1195025-Prorocentrum_minimum.AAC.5